MIEKEKVLSGLHCRGQDLMIDSPACDGCRYHVQMVNRMGCDFRQLCRDALALLKEQPEIIRCKDCKHRGNSEKCVLTAISEEKDFPLFMLDNRGEWFCADGARKDS